jgi:4-cresol dehydrogenase (hydroxylating)
MPADPELVQELQRILGPEDVVADADAIERSTRTCLPFRTLASIVIYPRATEQVQAVIAAAGRANVPIWAVSTGKNWGYGERTAVYEAGITMILERMNRILHVDEDLGYAVIEPGVTVQAAQRPPQEDRLPPMG